MLNFELSRVWILFLQDSMNLILLNLNFASHSITMNALLSRVRSFESHTRVSLRPKRIIEPKKSDLRGTFGLDYLGYDLSIFYLTCHLVPMLKLSLPFLLSWFLDQLRHWDNAKHVTAKRCLHSCLSDLLFMQKKSSHFHHDTWCLVLIYIITI